LAKHQKMLLYCRQPSVYTHTHTSLRTQQQYEKHTHTQTDTLLVLISCASGPLCSVCIYLSVVQRLHATEINTKGQRAGGGERIC